MAGVDALGCGGGELVGDVFGATVGRRRFPVAVRGSVIDTDQDDHATEDRKLGWKLRKKDDRQQGCADRFAEQRDRDDAGFEMRERPVDHRVAEQPRTERERGENQPLAGRIPDSGWPCARTTASRASVQTL